jgi:hypothetical protein
VVAVVDDEVPPLTLLLMVPNTNDGWQSSQISVLHKAGLCLWKILYEQYTFLSVSTWALF